MKCLPTSTASFKMTLSEFIRQIPRDRRELFCTACLALVFVVLYNSSGIAFSIGIIGMAIALPLFFKKPEYALFLLVIIAPFRSYHLISALHVKRLIIWAMFLFLTIRQLLLPRKFFSRQLMLFSKFTALFLVALGVALIQIRLDAKSSAYFTAKMFNSLFFSDALVVVEQLLLLYIAYYVITSYSQLLRLLDVMLAASAGIALLGIFQYYLGGPPQVLGFLYWPGYRFYGRASSVFPNPNSLGGYLAPLLVFVIFFACNRRYSLFKRLGFYLPIGLLNSWAIFLSFSRMAMIQILFSFLALSLLYYIQLNRKKFTWKILALVLINIALLFSAYHFYARYAHLRAKGNILQSPSAALERIKSVSDATRIQAAKTAFQTFLAHPLFGVGYGGLARKPLLALDWVENQFLKIMGEMGLFGFLPFVGMLAVIVITALKFFSIGRVPTVSREAQMLMILILTGVLTNAFGYLFVDSLSDSRITHLWIWGGVIFSLESQNRNNKIAALKDETA